jgi:hypothetical protein
MQKTAFASHAFIAKDPKTRSGAGVKRYFDQFAGMKN